MDVSGLEKHISEALPKPHSEFFVSTMGIGRIGFTVRATARILKVTAATISKKIQRQTILHFFVNGRPFVKPEAIATCGQTGIVAGVCWEVRFNWVAPIDWVQYCYCPEALAAVAKQMPFNSEMRVKRTIGRVSIPERCTHPNEVYLSLAPLCWLDVQWGKENVTVQGHIEKNKKVEFVSREFSFDDWHKYSPNKDITRLTILSALFL